MASRTNMKFSSHRTTRINVLSRAQTARWANHFQVFQTDTRNIFTPLDSWGREKLGHCHADNRINPTYEHIRCIYVCTIINLCTKRTMTRTSIVTQQDRQEMPCNSQYEDLVGRTPSKHTQQPSRDERSCTITCLSNGQFDNFFK